MVSENPGPVRFEWAVKLRVPLPVSNYSERSCPPLRFCKGLFATVNSFEPHNSLPLPRGWPVTSQGNRGCQAALQIGSSDTFAPLPLPLVMQKKEVSSALVPPFSDPGPPFCRLAHPLIS